MPSVKLSPNLWFHTTKNSSMRQPRSSEVPVPGPDTRSHTVKILPVHWEFLLLCVFVLEEIKRLYVVYIQGLGTYKLKWQQQVKDWVISSKTGLEQILIKKMPATYDGCPPSQADITALHERLRKQAETWLKSQEHIQMSQVTSVCHQYEARIKSWERQAINLVKKVAENMKCCTDGKDKKIVIYKKCLT